MIDYTTENEKQKIIIKRFDQVLSDKSSKNQISVLYDHIQKHCSSKEENDQAQERV